MGNDFLDASDRVSDLKGNLSDNLGESTRESMGDTRDEAERQVERNDSIATGHLTESLQLATTDEHADMVASYKVAAPHPYEYLEYGTGPRGEGEHPAPDPVPPIEPIITWIVEKGIQPREYDTIYGLAGAIQETIGMMGTHPHPFMRPAWRSGRGKSHVIGSAKSAMRSTVSRF